MLKKKPRQPCSCQGQTSEHRLISNCLSCGRIICDHEGLPCLFCSSRPPTSSPPPLASTFLPSSSFPPSSSPPSPSLEKALRMKEQLLAFDRNQSAENNVFDEQLDYFELNENVWLSKEVKEQAVKEIIEEKKVREEYNRGINVQFVDGKWEEVKEKGDENASKRKAQQLCQKSLQKERETREKEGSKGGESLSFDDRVGDQVYVQLRNEWNEKYKQYREKMEKKKCEGNKMFKVIAHDEGFSGGFVKVFEKKLEEIGGEKGDLNIYDREIFDLNGESGKCLSMLQPWASLMVEGFKRFEGRFWNTEYRGPLWVHAGATQPDPETIRRTENQYLK